MAANKTIKRCRLSLKKIRKCVFVSMAVSICLVMAFSLTSTGQGYTTRLAGNLHQTENLFLQGFTNNEPNSRTREFFKVRKQTATFLHPTSDLYPVSDLYPATDLHPASDLYPANDLHPASDLYPATDLYTATDLGYATALYPGSDLYPASDLFPARDRHPASDLQKARSSFMSPFVVQEKGIVQAELGADGASTTATKNSSRTKTFAVIVNCMNTGPGCFYKDNYPTAKCPYKCRQTQDLGAADVVVFFVWRMLAKKFIPKFHRPANQRWVMWTNEAASGEGYYSMLDFPRLKGQFNWTLTYRLDSDIVDQYGRLQRQTLPDKNYEQIYRGKTFLAAWFVSHCTTNSSREIYVRRMQKVVDVHVFGSCGTYNCSGGSTKRDNDTRMCLPMLSKSYHFYLAFENTLCKDYVTEKFFKLFKGVDVIPVVRGGADYKRLLPPGTFIDASDFKSPEELAEFLVDLSKSSSRYISLLKEKSRYRYVQPRDNFCDMCEKMMTDSSTKWYPDVRTWFTKDQCYNPLDL